MNAKAPEPIKLNPNKPLSLIDKHFIAHRWEYYKYLREQMPVHKVKMMGINLTVVARYEDCLMVAKDNELFGRDRAAITGGSKLPFPVPKNIQLLANSMIIEDDPQHRRLRQLVQKAFAPRSLELMEERLGEWAKALVDACADKGEFYAQSDFALQLPSKAISMMMGIDEDDMPLFQESLRVLSEGMSGWRVARTMFWDLRKSVAFVRDQVEKKRANPGEDILSALIHAEEDGDRLTEDELVSMVFLLIVAGFETTTSLISNSIITFNHHPDQLERLHNEPRLLSSAVEELLRFAGPIHGTKMNYARQDMELRGVHIPKGTAVMPLLGSANRDETVFEDPDRFDIARDPNKHLSFSQGNHFCLGAFLARMETKIALETLYQRFDKLEFVDEPEVAPMPGWYRYKDYRVRPA